MNIKKEMITHHLLTQMMGANLLKFQNHYTKPERKKQFLVRRFGETLPKDDPYKWSDLSSYCDSGRADFEW